MKKTTEQFLELNNFKELTNVQKKTLEFANSRKDVIALSKTGTGKTHAYLIPIAENINPLSDKTQVLISLPTRELAYQVYQNAKVLCEVMPELRISMLSGGTDKKRSSDKLNNKQPHIIIGTPGRIKDLFVNNLIRVDFVQMFIIDEADMTLEYGFLEDIDAVFSHMVKNPEIMCFSATFPKQLEQFTKKYLNNPKIIRVEDKKRDPKIAHILVPCKHKDYKEKLTEVLSLINPYMCLIFANSKQEADATYEYLSDNGYKTLLLHGGLESRERQKAIKALNSKQYTYIVASDVASRGIDIDGISHVVSMGFPRELEFYVHRAGRTGRNTKDGTVYALYKEEDINAIKSLEKQGIIFKAQDIKGDSFKDIKSPTYKRVKKNDEIEKQIAKTLTKKNQKVKPNYKKKKQRAIEEIKRKQRRDFIRQKIREERVERYKLMAREKAEDKR
ncbi:MAG: DEAD/DEAH box helicase [Erysipelotrichaceae bacterium]|nr:DEAD/DEAH box helicase [Erysipelotrichaceae bacterium]